MSGEQATPVPVVAVNKPTFGAWLATWLTIIIALSAIVLVILPLFGIHVVVGPLEQPAAPAQEAPIARPVATTVIRVVPAPQQAEPPAQVQAEQGGSVPASQPVQPVIVEQPQPVEVVPTVYVPPAAPIVQPTPDAWYLSTIREQERGPCSMPRANPQACAGDVPPLPWPEGRTP